MPQTPLVGYLQDQNRKGNYDYRLKCRKWRKSKVIYLKDIIVGHISQHQLYGYHKQK